MNLAAVYSRPTGHSDPWVILIKKTKKKTIKWNVLDYLNVKLLGLYLTFILCIELKYISNVIIYATISNIVDS